jgi:1-acyl-sn-glycerol-3-phosphate acyltransferase
MQQKSSAKWVIYNLFARNYKITLSYLTTQNTYFSPEQPIPWFARRNPTAVFYAKILMIVLKASRLCRKGVYTNDRWIQSSLNTMKALESVGGRFKIQNLAVPRTRESSCVFVSNHMSILETFVLPCLIQPYRDVTFVVKESLLSFPFFKHVMRNRNPIVVGRANPREDLRTVLEEGQNRLNANISVIIFPQTTRSINFDHKKFNSLGVKLAKRSKVPVIPIALKTDAWGVGHRFKDFGKIRPAIPVHITFGDPLYVKDSGKEEHKFIVDFISNTLDGYA